MDAELPQPESVVFLDMETTGFNPYQDKVVAIQVRRGGKTTIWKEWELGERCVIECFLAFANPIDPKMTSFVGYNVLKFDLPFLTRRADVNGLLNETSWETLYSFHYVDLYQLLGDNYARAESFYEKLAGRTQNTKNKEIPGFYQQRAYDKIVEYIENEMESVELLYKAVLQQEFYQSLVQLRKEVINPSGGP